MSRIRISLQHLRMAAKQPRSGTPICHEETMKVINALQVSNTETAPVHKYIKLADKCMEEAKAEKKRRKASTLFFLTQFLGQRK